MGKRVPHIHEKEKESACFSFLLLLLTTLVYHRCALTAFSIKSTFSRFWAEQEEVYMKLPVKASHLSRSYRKMIELWTQPGTGSGSDGSVGEGPAADLFAGIIEGLSEGSRGVWRRSDRIRPSQSEHSQRGAFVRGAAVPVLPGNGDKTKRSCWGSIEVQMKPSSISQTDELHNHNSP